MIQFFKMLVSYLGTDSNFQEGDENHKMQLLKSTNDILMVKMVLCLLFCFFYSNVLCIENCSKIQTFRVQISAKLRVKGRWSK